MPRKGSIAASRDVDGNAIARRGSLAIARDLELGEGRMMSEMQRLKDAMSKESKPKADVEVKCEQVRAGSSEGVQEIDYRTMQVFRSDKIFPLHHLLGLNTLSVCQDMFPKSRAILSEEC